MTPQPGMVSLDGLMAGSITLLGSTVVTVIAEKYDAMVDRGAFNTRMKDYFDLATLARRQAFSGHELTRAISATLVREGLETWCRLGTTAVPSARNRTSQRGKRSPKKSPSTLLSKGFFTGRTDRI